MRKLATPFYGVLFCVGLAIQLITSITWQYFNNQRFGEGWLLCGQAVGELCYFFIAKKLLENYGFFVAVVDFAISLILVDLFTIVFLNPYEISVPKYAGFVIAFLILMFRAKKYIKPNG
jgi:hypothetical protein